MAQLPVKKIFIYCHTGQNPHMVRVFDSASWYKTGAIQEIPCDNTPVPKLKKLMTEMFAPCEFWEIEILPTDNDGDK